MSPQMQISFRGMDPSPAVEAAIRERSEKLSRFYDRLIGCHVLVEAPHRHSHKGKIYHVRIDLSLPGRKIVVGKEPERNHAHEDVYVAIRDSFRAARRQLEDAVRIKSGLHVKEHPEKLHGRVARLVAEEGYGFITTAEGTEFFFRRESLASPGHWDALEVGTEVRFRKQEGEEGLHASAVNPA